MIRTLLDMGMNLTLASTELPLALGRAYGKAASGFVKGITSAFFGPSWSDIKDKIGPDATKFLKKLSRGDIHPRLEDVLEKKGVQKDLLRLFSHKPFQRQFGDMDEQARFLLVGEFQSRKVQKAMAQILADKDRRRELFYELGWKWPDVQVLPHGGYLITSYTRQGYPISRVSETKPAESGSGSDSPAGLPILALLASVGQFAAP